MTAERDMPTRPGRGDARSKPPQLSSVTGPKRDLPFAFFARQFARASVLCAPARACNLQQSVSVVSSNCQKHRELYLPPHLFIHSSDMRSRALAFA